MEGVTSVTYLSACIQAEFTSHNLREKHKCVHILMTLNTTAIFENLTVIHQSNLTQYSCSIEVHAPKSFETLLVKVIELEINKSYAKILCVCMLTVSQSVLLYFIQANIIKPPFYVYMSVSWQ